MNGMENTRGRHPGRDWTANLGQALLLLAASLLLGCLLWAVRPDRLPLKADLALYDLELAAPVVQIPAAINLFEQGDHLFIDTRMELQAGQAVIPGAFFLRAASFDDDLSALFEYLGPEDPLIIYGDGDLTTDSFIVTKLQERGYLDLQILAGGFPAWVSGGGETSAFRGATEP